MAGRPPRVAGARLRITQVQSTEAEHDEWARAATLLGYKSLSDFIRITLGGAANDALEAAAAGILSRKKSG